jgi:anti-sigma factor ChrR (cupin superfamily)
VKSILLALALGLVLAIPVAAQDSTATQAPSAATAQPAAASTSAHVMINPIQIKWGDPPPVLRKGAKFAVVSGDPGAPGPYTIRLKMPAGYKIAPHWHPTDENVTVISGTFSLGMGEKFEQASMKTLAAGGFALLPAEMRHFAWTKTGATVQVHGTGPFVLTYVNPADDPSQAGAAK